MKNIIAIAALLAAGTALANAAEVSLDVGTPSTTNLISRPGSSDLSLTLGGVASDKTSDTNISVADVQNYLGNKNVGWYIGCGTGNTGVGTTPWTVNDDGSFSLSGRNNYLGVYFADVISLDSLWSSLEDVSSINVSFDLTNESTTAANNHFKFTAWSIGSNGVATQVGSTISSDLAISGTQSVSFSADSLNLTEEASSKIVLLFSSGTASWVSTKISNLSASVTGTPIPEPSAFGLLAGLGALALAASRRRRSRK